MKPQNLYLELLKKCLTDTIHIERGYDNKREIHIVKGGRSIKQLILNLLVWLLSKRKMKLYYIRNQNLTKDRMLHKRQRGEDWPVVAETMIGMARLNNLQECVETVIKEEVPGNLIETGVWRGGACIFMRGILKAYNVTDRKVFVADSFCGLPPPEHEEDAGDTHHLYKEELAVSLEEVISNFESYELLDDQVEFVEGFFAESLPIAETGKLAVLRLDGDMYGSTMDAITALYDRVSDKGFIIVDDYHLEGCRKAIDEFRDANGIETPLIQIDKCGVYWRK